MAGQHADIDHTGLTGIPSGSGGTQTVDQFVTTADQTLSGNSMQAFSTDVTTSITVASGEKVRIDVAAQWSHGSVVDVVFGVFRGGTEISRKAMSNSHAASWRFTSWSFIDESPGTGTITYNLRCHPGSTGTLTLYGKAAGTSPGQSSLAVAAFPAD